MDCEQTRTLLDAYLDGELDLVHSLELERHLRTCSECSILYQNRQLLREGLGRESLYFKAPPGLQRRIRHSLQPSRPARQIRWIALAAAVIGLVLVAGILLKSSAISADELLSDEVLASHIRSLMAGHLQDVISTDQHTVKPWFDGKLDFSPPVVDLSANGFVLIGGRLDYLDHRNVAALVYQRNKHMINLFVWPTAEPPHSYSSTRQGYHLIQWTQEGLAFWAASDVNESDLVAFVRLLQEALPQIGSTPEPRTG